MNPRSRSDRSRAELVTDIRIGLSSRSFSKQFSETYSIRGSAIEIEHGEDSAIFCHGAGNVEVRIWKSYLEHYTDQSSQLATALPDRRAPQITAAPSHTCFTRTETVAYTGHSESSQLPTTQQKVTGNQCTAPCAGRSTLQPVWDRRQ